MSSLNKVILIGNIGKDPEIRNTSTGQEIANLVLATSEKWKDKNSGEQKEKTEWHKVVVFSQGLVNVIKNYVKKGSKIYIEGQLQTRKWTGKDGQEKYTTEIVMQGYNCNLIMLDSKNSNSASESTHNDDNFTGRTSEDFANDLDDEMPF